MNSQISWCTSCLNVSTRPRIKFDESGRCNACVWAEQKKSLNWEARTVELTGLLDTHRGSSQGFDCLVPVSGGKDGSYVAYKLKNQYGMRPLTATVRPPLSLPIGESNLLRFIDCGFDHVHITPNARSMRTLNRLGLIDMGFPYYGWLIAIQTAVLRLAVDMQIPLVFYGEDGEVEYGGSSETATSSTYDIEYMRRIYLEGGHDRILDAAGLDREERYLFTFPDTSDLRSSSLRVAHWSYFESWDPYRNYLVAKEHCGLQEASETNSGTFTNFAQNDQALYALHAFLMYLKFGFGRATQDAGIEIRRGAMTRDQGLNLVRLYDGQFPSAFLNNYLEYYEMTEDQFFSVLDRWAHPELFERNGNTWIPKFRPE